MATTGTITISAVSATSGALNMNDPSVVSRIVEGVANYLQLDGTPVNGFTQTITLNNISIALTVTVASS